VQLCIKNKGDQTTKNLRIFLKLQKKCNKLWEDVEKCVSLSLSLCLSHYFLLYPYACRSSHTCHRFEMKTTNRECKPHNHVECFEDQIYVPKDCKIEYDFVPVPVSIAVAMAAWWSVPTTASHSAQP
jgi:hypothetical protein